MEELIQLARRRLAEFPEYRETKNTKRDRKILYPLQEQHRSEMMFSEWVLEISNELNHSDSLRPVETFKTKTDSVFQENQFDLDEHLVFMLSPFGKPFDTIFTNHIRPTVEKTLKLNCVRADDIYDNQPVIDDIWASY